MKPISRTLPTMRALLCASLLALSACVSAGVAARSGQPDDAQRIIAMMQESTNQWNRGSLEGFLLPYDEAADITFVGSTGLVRGKDAVREKYRASYFRTGAPEGNLAFRDMEVRPLGPDHALAVGRYVVTERASGRETATGLFSLVLRRTAQGWRIMHDHSS